MQVQKEKAHLAVEILGKFTDATVPIDLLDDLFNNLLTDFNNLIEKTEAWSENQQEDILPFGKSFSEFVNQYVANRKLIGEFKDYILERSEDLVEEYQKIANGS